MTFRTIASLLGLSAVVTALALGACGGETVPQTAPDGGANPGPDPANVSDGSTPGLPDEDRPLIPASKVDLLLVVDNSSSMSDKAKNLAASIGVLLRAVAKVGDVHVGVISTSLGSFGGDVCPNEGEFNGLSHLRTTGPGGVVVAGAESGVLTLTPNGDVDAFVAAASSLVSGVGETGCGLEAQLEATYRFLSQPDPWQTISLDGFNQARMDGIDNQLLAQRKAFLRPDSVLVVVMLTDEDDSGTDPLSVGGQGWAFSAKDFPGSRIVRGNPKAGTTAPRGTTPCATDPGAAGCTSCGFAALCDPSQADCQKLKSDPACTTSGMPGQSGVGFDGYYGPEDDSLNVRFHRMKERFGIDPQYPIARYVDGFTKSVVPNRDNEHFSQAGANGQRQIGAYHGTPNCTNPIFAATLPSSSSEELCTRARGPRSRELVVFAVIGGVPPQLANDTPNWTAILGNDPDHYDLSGIDPHMIQSVSPRASLIAPSAIAGDNGTDPVHGREWNTAKNDLQYACTFDLPAPKQCSSNDFSCECGPDVTGNPPLCNASHQQIKAKAYPSVRPLRVVRGLADRGVASSICSSSYDATMSSLVVRLANRLAK